MLPDEILLGEALNEFIVQVCDATVIVTSLVMFPGCTVKRYTVTPTLVLWANLLPVPVAPWLKPTSFGPLTWVKIPEEQATGTTQFKVKLDPGPPPTALYPSTSKLIPPLVQRG